MEETKQCSTSTQNQMTFESIPHLLWLLGKNDFLKRGVLLFVPSYIESALLKLVPYFDSPPIGPLDVGSFPVGLISPRVIKKKVIAYSTGISTLLVGENFPPSKLIKILEDAGYQKVSYVKNKGEYAVRGEVIDFYFGQPIRVLFDEDVVESIRIFSSEDQLPIASIPHVSLPTNIEYIPLTEDNIGFAGYKKRVLISPRIWRYEVGEYLFQYDVVYVEKINTSQEYDFKRSKAIKVITVFPDRTIERFRSIGIDARKVEKLSFSNTVEVVPGFFEDSFKSEDISLLNDYDLWPEIVGIKKRRTTSSIEVGSYVIHRLYGGIGIVESIEETPSPRIVVRYKNDVRIKTPITMMNMLYPYVNASGHIEITEVERKGWKRKKKKLEEIIEDAIEKFVEREKRRRNATAPIMQGDPEIEQIIASSFPYELTTDQEKAIEEVISDLMSGRPMDRIICGDTGFGKTEVAIRAAARVVSSGYQVIVAAPTSILVRQLYRDFKNRFDEAGITVGFYTKGKGKLLIEEFKKGTIDILIGTHSVLTDKIAPPKIGLVIVDDEHLFGVEMKEFYRNKYPHVHHLYMSATPIPRTLFHGMSGLKSISLLETPPRGRQPVDVVVAKRINDKKVIEVIRDEIESGEKVIFVHNRVKDLIKYAGLIATALPRAKVGVLHGRMPNSEVERVLNDVYSGKVDVLVATSIVGTGLNLLDFNVIVVNDIKYMGLASLYQIKGRVGRTENSRGRVYFFYTDTPRVKEPRFLEVLSEFGNLGYGFMVANLDMELRGIGNVFGIKQSGFFDVDTYGFELIKSIVAESIARIAENRHSKLTIKWSYIPFDFLTSDDRVMVVNILTKADWNLWEKFKLFVQSTYGKKIEDEWDDYFALIDIVKNVFSGHVVVEISRNKVSILTSSKRIEEKGQVPEVFGSIIFKNF